MCGLFAGGATVASADEAGISFWVPGTYGALAAAPLPQGFSIAEIYYHSPIKGGGDVAIARQVPIAGVTTKVPSTLEIHIGVQNDLLLSIPSYVFATPVLGGQLPGRHAHSLRTQQGLGRSDNHWPDGGALEGRP